MKIKITEKYPQFVPFDFVITIESKEDFATLWHKFNTCPKIQPGSCHWLECCYSDIIGARLWTEIEKVYKQRNLN